MEQFQYISCCSLSNPEKFFSIDRFGFNTSHVVVYRQNCHKHRMVFHVSIHLMLQFIGLKPSKYRFIEKFQYISCCSLSYQAFFCTYCHCRFNTSHVVVYHQPLKFVCCLIWFQYISCCSLSVKAFVCSFMQPGFNTSHVVVYPKAILIECCFVEFQYISCCSLSCNHRLWRPAGNTFQYISCCSLSGAESSPLLISLQVSIHLMLQFIRYRIRYLCDNQCFNTSHVVVYR